MNAIITIDTSTTVCSVALVTESECLAYREDTSGNNHSKVIGVFVKEILAEAKRLNADVRAVALSKGPGSYTGLRIGTSFAKGLCYGMDIKLMFILCQAAEALKALLGFYILRKGTWANQLIKKSDLE